VTVIVMSSRFIRVVRRAHLDHSSGRSHGIDHGVPCSARGQGAVMACHHEAFQQHRGKFEVGLDISRLCGRQNRVWRSQILSPEIWMSGKMIGLKASLLV
jgi:hypothetical protein